MPTKKKKTCEHCSACTKVTRHKGDVFVCWGVSEPFEIEDITKPCRAYPDMKEENFSEHWRDETNSAIAERAAVEKRLEEKARQTEWPTDPNSLPSVLTEMGFVNLGEVVDFLQNSVLFPHEEIHFTLPNSCDVTIWYIDENGFMTKYEVPENESIAEAEQKCLKWSGMSYGSAENFIRRTKDRIDQLEQQCENHYIEMYSMAERIDWLEEEVKKLTEAGAKDKLELQEQVEEMENLVDIMKSRPEYKQFHDELEKEGFFTGTGLGSPDFGEVYKRYFAQKKTIEQYQKYAKELEAKLEEAGK